MLQSLPPRTKLELKSKYREINLNNQLKMGWTKILQARVYRRSCIENGENGGNGGDMKRSGLAPTGGGWDSRGIS